MTDDFYPYPSSPAVTAIMKGNRRADTKPEQQVRSALHRLGFRFRKDLLVRTPDVSVRPDVVFPRQRVAIFIDGCFWHGCPEHGRVPKVNTQYWPAKLARNVARDERVTAGLRADGWTVLRFWEHTPSEVVVDRVAEVLDRSVAPSR